MHKLVLQSATLDRLLSSLWSIPLVMLCLVGLPLMWFTFDEYEQTLDQEFRFLESHVRIADEHLSGLLRNVDLMLARVAADRLATPAHRLTAFEAGLEEKLRAFPEARTFLVADAKGVMELSTNPQVKGFDASQRDYFTAHRDGTAGSALFVSRPFVTVTGKTSITISRAIIDNEHRFQGVVGIGVDPRIFDGVLQTILPAGSGGTSAILNRHGDVLNRQPDAERYIGRNVSSGKPFQEYLRSGARALHYVGTPALSPDKRLFVLHQIGNTNLSVVVSRPLDSVMAPWYRNLKLRVLYLGLVTAITLFLGWIACRRQREVKDGKTFTDQVIDTANVMVVGLDQAGRVAIFNKAAEAVSGYNRTEVLGRNWVEMVTPKAHETIRKAFPTLRAGQIPTSLETPILTSEGEERIIAWQNSAIPENPERAALIAFGVDITERKRMDAALLDSEQRWRKVFEQSPIGAAVMSLNFQYMNVNDALCRITGYDRAELLACSFADITHPEDLQDNLNLVRQLKEGRIDKFVKDKRYLSKDGQVLWCHVSVSLMRNAAGEPVHFVALIQDITERKTAEERIHFLAHHDALTGLANRTLAQDRFRQAVAFANRSGSKIALLFIDLDNFKTINDSLGHAVGDGMIREVAARLSECVRGIDTVSRQGGDEFLILLSNLPDREATAPIVSKLMKRLHDPIEIHGHELNTSCSIGISVYPDDGGDFDTLLKKSDMAMYRAKDAGRNTSRYFNETMNVEAVEQLSMRNGLRKALERDEFVLHYQPQVDLSSGALIRAEALIRWNHPEFGLVAPDRFIPVAEDCGLIVPMGEWVLRQACRQAAAWQRAGISSLVVAVNLSAVQFKCGDIEQSVIRALAESGIDPCMLELELTESILIQDTESVLATVKRLKLLGVQLSIDDFGTGYSSLSYLKRFEVDKLKIDRSFIRDLATDPDDAAIVRAIIQVARSLGLRTIAEGVEDERVLSHLRIFKCDEAQGNYFARPMPADMFNDYLWGRTSGYPEIANA